MKIAVLGRAYHEIRGGDKKILGASSQTYCQRRAGDRCGVGVGFAVERAEIHAHRVRDIQTHTVTQ